MVFLSEGSALKNRFAFLSIEAPGWQGTKRVDAKSIGPTSNAVRQSGRRPSNVKLSLSGL